MGEERLPYDTNHEFWPVWFIILLGNMNLVFATRFPSPPRVACKKRLWWDKSEIKFEKPNCNKPNISNCYDSQTYFILCIVSFNRTPSQWMYQCGNYNNWKTFWLTFSSNRISSQWLWYIVVCVLSAGNIFRWASNSIKAKMDRYRHDIDGFGFIGVCLAAFHRRHVSSNKCRSKCLSNGRRSEHSKC